MNFTSAAERGGSVALVEGGSVLVGWPGAPGCTRTGFEGLACCALIVSEHTLTRILAAISPFRDAETFNITLTMKSIDRRLDGQAIAVGKPYHKVEAGSACPKSNVQVQSPEARNLARTVLSQNNENILDPS